MKRTLKRSLLALIAVFAAAALPARAASYGTVDYTDLWYNPAESGWGINVIQQSNVIFATLFIYGTDSSPTWFVASDVEPTPATSLNVFGGTLYKTTGPSYSATSFDPSAVHATAVGTVTFTFTGDGAGTLQYVINGTTVTKSIQRQSWRTESFASKYYGGWHVEATCPGNTPGQLDLIGDITVTQSSPRVVFQVAISNPGAGATECDFQGPYIPSGSHGAINDGSFACDTGNTGNFTMTSIQVNPNGFTAVFHGKDSYCNYDGYFGGLHGVN